MGSFPRLRFLAIALVFHFVYIFSIFDIYFVSPIVSGMRLFEIPRPVTNRAPADRLVLFVGDGLRADKALQSHPEPYPKTDDDLTPRPLAPFLRSKILEDGTFGVSHTRVPTESRPGHVALIAGLYEDVSAVTTGWKLNPVNFDSLFNRSSHTWSWGSPDILPMFEQGAVPGRVDAFTYGAELEDFSSEATVLDLWVFDHVKDFFAEAERNTSLRDALHQQKIVFFLHLLGLDTTGHYHRPYSKEYLHNIKVVDQGVKEICELIESFYGDDRTAFVFTADHGMSDYGSHGDGHPDNTRTPLIAWGSGVAKPQLFPGEVARGHDEYSSDWNLDHVRRHDVAQADVAALMSYLVGVEYPANSVGELPLSYLNADIREKAEATLVNAQGILEQYRVKEENKKATELRYRPYRLLSDKGLTPERRVAEIRQLIDAGNYEEAIEEAATLMKIGLDGLRYLQTYDWLFLRALITIGYLGWIAYALTTVIDLHVLHGSIKPSRTPAGKVVFSSILVLLYSSFVISESPITYYAYAFFPVFFWEGVYARWGCLVEGRKHLFGHIKSSGAAASLLFNSAIYVAIIVSLALGYIYREILTGLFILGSFWPAAYGISFLQKHTALSVTWFLSCVAMSAFTLLPAMKTEDVNLIMIGGALMVLAGILYLVFEDFVLADFSWPEKPTAANNCVSRVLLGTQIGLILLAMIVTRSSALSLQAKLGLPPGNQILGWFVLVASLLMPLAYRLQPSSHYMHRLVVIFLTCAPTFVILTISYEGLFYVAFSSLLVCWVRLEHAVYRFSLASRTSHRTNGSTSKAERDAVSPYRPLLLHDARVALFFFVLLQSAFFSTGNVASVSSFSLESVVRLIPVFDPFSQGAMLILKLMIPFALISANLGILNKRLGVAPSALLMVVMAISDILTLYFFWVVKDEGSWLEIGSTISHFVIASLLCIFVAALEAVSAMFVSGVEVSSEEGQGARKGAHPRFMKPDTVAPSGWLPRCDEATARQPAAHARPPPTLRHAAAMDVDTGMGDNQTPAPASVSPPQQSGQGATGAAAASAAAQMSFRRQRASRACETCHARKVRCDAASLGIPCTNCAAFSIECRIPTPKRKKTQGASVQSKDSDSERGDADERSPNPPGTSTFPSGTRPPAVYHTSEAGPTTATTEELQKKEELDNATLANYMSLVMKPKFTRAPITEAGRVAFMGESSNLTLLVHDRQNSSDVVHYPLPDAVKGSRARLTQLDEIEIEILHRRGAFLLPPRSLCDELIESYFKWVHPIVPVINRTKFMRQYKDPKNPPSLLLLQAVLLAGSRVCTNPQLMDANGSTTPAALTFYKRAKALYDANYEDDRVTIVQSLLLMGWYWEGPEDVTKNVFYWSRVATIVAQGSGMHRSVETSQLTKSDKRLWKRIWWSLFTRDRSVAVALGRPCHINLDDSDVEMLTEDDFIEDEPDQRSEYPPDPIHVNFFLQYVKLCEIMGLVLSQQYSVASKGRRQNAIDLTHSDMALADWLQNCPKVVYWEGPRHHFWSALLHSNYYTTLCLLHRAHMPPSGSSKFPEDAAYPSRNIAFQAAGMITSIIENLVAHGELRYCPAFVVYSLFSALIMHVYQMRSPVPTIQQVTQNRIQTCMGALREISKVWLVGKMVYTLFESILGNKVMEERLQKAAGKRHRKNQQALAQLEQHRVAQDQKRKYDEMAIDFSVSTPQPQESYERSGSQTPSHAAKGEQLPSAMAPPHLASPNTRNGGDAFMGGTASRPQTRPATPFNPSFSVPATPPDLYLVTRNSPNLSQAIWENFQPDQLFPESSALPVYVSPSQAHQGLDQGMMAQMQSHNLQGNQEPQSQFGVPKRGVTGSPLQGHSGLMPGGMGGFQGQQPGAGNMWQSNFDTSMMDGQSPSDTWSNSSAQGQPVPSTLNVEDWFQFFGINGDAANGINFDGIQLG
ncbi:GPI ethanolamine phosphate transferase [Echria macrotheca]|uniref:GPI ethanolamine phosphate transferase 1 n=1 Tax=Echria macrotheca TaxID=438768 RepID=A0AAJ0BDN0_9PEZI|nr:GPI ethanolamine phosphate transferase [Echria macrotheca]